MERRAIAFGDRALVNTLWGMQEGIVVWKYMPLHAPCAWHVDFYVPGTACVHQVSCGNYTLIDQPDFATRIANVVEAGEHYRAYLRDNYDNWARNLAADPAMCLFRCEEPWTIEEWQFQSTL